jgi:hypothetical protein
MLQIDPQCIQPFRWASYAAARALWNTSSVTVTGSHWSSSRAATKTFQQKVLARRWSTDCPYSTYSSTSMGGLPA